MSDDFGTISARRGDRTKEIEVLRKHRESLVQMLADVDQQLRELEIFDTPGARPLVTTPDYEDPLTTSMSAQPGAGPRVLLIIGAALVALVLIAWLIWRASSDRPAASSTVADDTTAAASAEDTETMSTAPATIADAPSGSAEVLAVVPASRDYGLVRKGTRVTRQYEVANNSDEPVSITLARSACRCLYYEHAPVIPPKSKESVTVTIDGAKAEAGTLRETIRVSVKADPSVGTSFDIIATVR